MKSGVSFMDIAEAAVWIAAQLEKEGVAVGDDLVLRILNRETAFLLIVGLARPGSEDRAQGGHLYRKGCWVLTPGAETEGDHDIESEGGEQDEQHEPR